MDVNYYDCEEWDDGCPDSEDSDPEVDYPDEEDVMWSDDEKFYPQAPSLRTTSPPSSLPRRRLLLIPIKPSRTREPGDVCPVCLDALDAQDLSYCYRKCGNLFHSRPLSATCSPQAA